jgi:hypothetical protein
MLDTFEILTTSGVVLWSRTYAPVGANIINSLIRDVFIEERILPQPEDAGSKPTYRKEGYTLKWTASKDAGLIFVVCNQIQSCFQIYVPPQKSHHAHKDAHASECMLSPHPGSIPKSSPLDMDRQASRQRACSLRRPLRRAVEDGAQQRSQLRQIRIIF